MKLTDKTIQVAGLSKITELTGGNKGVVFLLENKSGEKVVIKFQNEAPIGALAGTKIMQQAQASTPNVRLASRVELASISVEVSRLTYECRDACATFAEARSIFKHVLLMDYAEGLTLASLRTENAREFFAVLCDFHFQWELGKILAADVFSGNPDRMFGALVGGGGRLEGWYHEKNTLVTSNRRPVAIDNSFRPGVVSATLPWGRYMQGNSMQWGSVAAACRTLARKEAGLLFDEFVASTLRSHPDPDLLVHVNGKVRPKRSVFVFTVASGACDAMERLLTHGQHWGQSLSDFGATKSLLKQFRIRKRLLRQLAAGRDAEESLKTARNDTAYRKWFLTEQLGMPTKEADDLLLLAIEHYKKYKKERLGI